MPNRPMSVCLEPRCPTLVRGGGRCDKHKKAHNRAYEERRGSSTQRGYGAPWRRFSEYLRALHPLCGDRPAVAPATSDSRCVAEGRTTAGAHADHILPVSGPNDPRFFDESNIQILCHNCHQRKRRREQGGQHLW